MVTATIQHGDSGAAVSASADDCALSAVAPPSGPSLEELLAFLEAEPSQEVAQRYVDKFITETLGAQAVEFLAARAVERGSSGDLVSHLLLEAYALAKDTDHKGNDYKPAMLDLIDHYRTILDFDKKLAQSRMSLVEGHRESGRTVTVADGQSVRLLCLAIESLVGALQKESSPLTHVRQEIARIQSIVSDPVAEVPATATVDSAIPVTTSVAQEDGKLARQRVPIRIRSGGAHEKEQVQEDEADSFEDTHHSSKESVRGKQRTWKAVESIKSLLKVFTDRDEGPQPNRDVRAATRALGQLAPRSARSRYAQTGASLENQESRDAVSAFVRELPEIDAHLAENLHVRRLDMSFFVKEAQVVTDHEGKLERLDVYLLGTAEGRELFDVVYQPVSIPSCVNDRHIMIPVIPGCETSLPVPPGYYISALHYLDSKGEPIVQPECHSARVCIAGGAIVTPPLGARMVAYELVRVRQHGYSSASSCGPRALSPEEFTRLRNVLPRVAFDMGEEMENTYSIIRSMGRPEARISLARAFESRRGWIYSADSIIREFQRASGDAFLESVYHTRAGICDSMSAVGAHVMGNAIGLPGVVLSGPTNEHGMFDPKTGHSIAGSLLPYAVETFDITTQSYELSRPLRLTVSRSFQRLLSQTLRTPGLTRRGIAELYQDFGDRIRGSKPMRYAPMESSPKSPQQKLYHDVLTSATKPETPQQLPRISDEEKSVRRAAAIVLFDRITRRVEQTRDAGKLCWFTRTRLPSASAFESEIQCMIEECQPNERVVSLLRRDLETEVVSHLIRAIEEDTIPRDELNRLATTIEKSLYFEDALSIAEALLVSGRSPHTAAEIARHLIKTTATQIRAMTGEQGERLCERMSRLISSLNATAVLVDDAPFASSLDSLFRLPDDLSPKIASDRLLSNVLSLIGAVWTAGGKHSPSQFCRSQSSYGSPRLGLQKLKARDSEALARALGFDTPAGTTNLTAAVMSHLSLVPVDSSGALCLVSQFRLIVPDADMGPFGSQVMEIATTWIQGTVETANDPDAPLINWPSDDAPGSSLAFRSGQKYAGVRCIDLFLEFVQLNGMSKETAKSLWPTQDEVPVIQSLVKRLSVKSGGFLTLDTASGWEWDLANMPAFLAVLCESAQSPALSTTVRDVIEWRERQLPLERIPDEKHFLKMIDLLGCVPSGWGVDPNSWKGPHNRHAYAAALMRFIQSPLSDKEFYQAFHAVGPYLIAPSDPSLHAEFQTHVSTLAQSMRRGPSGEAASVLRTARTFTKRRPLNKISHPPGIEAACSIIDIAHQLDCDPGQFYRMTGIVDDGTLPDGQIWRSLLEPGDWTESTMKALYTSVATLRHAFTSQTQAARNKLRSPLCHYASSESGRMRIVGNSGSPLTARGYQVGDSLRQVDWRASARDARDGLLVKVREEREELSVTLVVDLVNLYEELERFGESSEDSVLFLLRSAPTLATMVYESMVADQAGLKVDVIFTHHAMVTSRSDAAQLILDPDKDTSSSRAWESIIVKARAAHDAKFAERKLWGADGFTTAVPLLLAESPLRKNSLVEFLLGPNSEREAARMKPALQARRHHVSAGVLPGLRRS